MIASARTALGVGLFALAYAVLAFVSGVDRYSEHRPPAVRLVPEPFRVDAARVEAATALSLGNYAQAAEHASMALRHDPLDPRGAAFLAAALAMQDRPAGAQAAFRQSARLGWREPLTQTYWFGRAMERGAVGAAAIRLDALLRAHPKFAPAQDYLSLLERSPQGRRALIERLDSDARWASAYLSASSGDDTKLRERAAFLSGEAARGLALGCGLALPMGQELARRGYRADHDALLRAHCPSAVADDTLIDGGFDRFGEDASTGQGWQRHGSGDVQITPLAGADPAVEIANRSSVTRLVLSQPVAVPAGSYRVRGSVRGGAAGRLLASLDCGEPQRPAMDAGSVGPAGSLVVAGECSNQVLGLWLSPGNDTVSLSSVSISAR